MVVKVLVDVDVLEELLLGYGDDCAGTATRVVERATPELRADIARAKKAK